MKTLTSPEEIKEALEIEYSNEMFKKRTAVLYIIFQPITQKHHFSVMNNKNPEITNFNDIDMAVKFYDNL